MLYLCQLFQEFGSELKTFAERREKAGRVQILPSNQGPEDSRAPAHDMRQREEEEASGCHTSRCSRILLTFVSRIGMETSGHEPDMPSDW